MKIQSTKPESAGQISSADATQTAASSTDILFNTLLNIPPEPTPEAQPSVTLNQVADNENDNEADSDPTNSSVEPIAGLLIDPMALSAKDQSIPVQMATSQTLVDSDSTANTLVATPSKLSSDVSTVLAQYNQTSQLTDQMPAKVVDQVSAQQNALLQDVPVDASDSANKFDVASMTSEGKDLFNKPAAQKFDLTQQNATVNPEETDANANTNANANVSDINLDIAKLSQSKQAPKLAQAGEKSPSDIDLPFLLPKSTMQVNGSSTVETDVSVNASKDTVSIQSTNPSMTNAATHNQYLNAFNHLGNFIQNQTSTQLNLANGQASLSSSDFKLAQSLISNQQLNQSIDNTVNIQLAPMIDSVMKGGYDAKIQLYPPELGQVLARLKMNQNSAELVITTENNHVKQIVEANLPQLKQHFQSINIDLTDVQVQSNNLQQQDKDKNQNNNALQQDDPVFYKNDSSKQKEGNSTTKSAAKSNHTVDTYA